MTKYSINLIDNWSDIATRPFKVYSIAPSTREFKSAGLGSTYTERWGARTILLDNNFVYVGGSKGI
jgi:hypothetical protein